MIDAHSHVLQLIDRFSLELLEARARSVGVTRVITCCCSIKDWSDSDVFSGNRFFVPQYGIHPWWAAELRPRDWLEKLKITLESNPRSGVGEIGLDKNKAKKGVVSMETQMEVFRCQLELAFRLKRPCTIHCVNAYGSLIDCFKSLAGAYKHSPVILHSFSGNGEHMRDLLRLNMNLYFSVSGHCPKEEVITHIPLEKMLLETDSPCMCITPPEGATDIGGTPFVSKLDESTNDSSQLLLVADRVARASGKPVDLIRTVTKANTIAAFMLD
jgi:TatD DNase family protein